MLNNQKKLLILGSSLWFIGTSLFFWIRIDWFLLVPVVGLIIIEAGTVTRHKYKNQVIEMIRFVAYFVAVGAIARNIGGFSALVDFSSLVFGIIDVYICSNIAIGAHLYLRITEGKSK
jgi:hypothetical protein